MAFPTPLSKVNIGVTANDGTGTALRDAFYAFNGNIDLVTDEVNRKAYATDLTGEVTRAEAAEASLTAALAGKLNIVDFTDSAVSPRFDGAQDIDNTERRQLSVNTGTPVVLMFQLVDSVTDPTSTSYDLPFLPDDFNIVDMFVTLTKRTVGTGGSWQLGYAMTNGTNTVGGATNTAIDATGKLGSTIVISGHLLSGGKANALSVTITDTETGSPVHKGLTLWLRGTWANPLG